MKGPPVQAMLLSGLLCASGFAPTEFLAEAQFVNSCAPVKAMLPEIVPGLDEVATAGAPLVQLPDRAESLHQGIRRKDRSDGRPKIWAYKLVTPKREGPIMALAYVLTLEDAKEIGP